MKEFFKYYKTLKKLYQSYLNQLSIFEQQKSMD